MEIVVAGKKAQNLALVPCTCLALRQDQCSRPVNSPDPALSVARLRRDKGSCGERGCVSRVDADACIGVSQG